MGSFGNFAFNAVEAFELRGAMAFEMVDLVTRPSFPYKE
jgi:hypothetical protein